jgi:hypothetical protein
LHSALGAPAQGDAGRRKALLHQFVVSEARKSTHLVRAANDRFFGAV